MKKFLTRFSFLLAIIFIVVSCAKDDSTPDEEEPPATEQGSFIWTLSSGQNVSADSAHCYNSITTVYAFKNGNSNSIEANLSSLAVGSYSISSATGNTFSYISGSTTYDGVSGTFNVSASANNKLSGSFNVNLSGGPLTSISGNFSDIRKR